jgi:hypothetical protein
MHAGLLVGTPGGKRPIGRRRSRWQIILKWINLAQDRDEWQALMNTVMTFGFHNMLRNS